MNISSDVAAPEFPPIVLLVDDDRDTLDMYSTYLEISGVWVARSTTPGQALAGVDDVRPDVVVMDVCRGRGSIGADLLHALKVRPETHDIPVIVLSGVPADDEPTLAPHEADLYLVKPVLPDALLACVRGVFQRNRELRARSSAVLAKTSELVERSTALLARSKTLATIAAGGTRPCPNCGNPLEWTERRRFEGIRYDYYRWCSHGCGLYCYNGSAESWVKLA